ncbi:hypothetical protein WN48_10684 [Eufriesea mexicana]|uniref:Uncharacterized protein n=1 Tax=Eufriesea mexicana TaxID=516756 RepID=A0A310SQS0_9HYME|nr:hypothetical protein WN48_10684 [Eufriesea mexicana]
MLIEALRNGVRRTAKPRLLLGRRVSTSSTKNLLHPLPVSSRTSHAPQKDTDFPCKLSVRANRVPIATTGAPSRTGCLRATGGGERTFSASSIRGLVARKQLLTR